MSSVPIALQLPVRDATGKWKMVEQLVELPMPLLPGIFLTNGHIFDIPRLAADGATVDTVIRGISLDCERQLAICVLPSEEIGAYLLDEWLIDHPRWQFCRDLLTEETESPLPDQSD